MTAKDIRALSVALFKALGSPVHYWMETAIDELLQWIEEFKEVSK